MKLPTRQKVFERVISGIKAVLDLPDNMLDTVTEATRFTEDLKIDSLEALMLVIEAENAIAEATGLNMVELTDDEIKRMITVGDAIDIILEKIKNIG